MLTPAEHQALREQGWLESGIQQLARLRLSVQWFYFARYLGQEGRLIEEEYCLPHDPAWCAAQQAAAAVPVATVPATIGATAPSSPPAAGPSPLPSGGPAWPATAEPPNPVR